MAIVIENFLTAALNQFQMTSVRGMYADWGLNAQVMEVTVSDDVAAALRPGDPVKLVSSPKGIPTVDKAAAADAIYGFYIWNVKSTTGSAGKRIGVLRDGGTMLMVTAEALTAGTPVYYKDADDSVSATVAGKPVGVALEDTTANENGTLVRIEVVKQPLA